MPVEITAWRAKIGLFNCYKKVSSTFPNTTTLQIDSSDFLKMIFVIKCFLVVMFNMLFSIYILAFLYFSIDKTIIFWLFIGGSRSPWFIFQNLTASPAYGLRYLLTIHIKNSIWTKFDFARITFLDILFLDIAYFDIKNLLLIISGNVHPNPGPGNKSRISFGIWNLDSLLTRDACKKTLVEALQSVHDFDIFGLCETYLNDSIENDKLKIEGFCSIPYRKDCKESNIRPRGGVCLYFKEETPIIEREKLVENFDEIIVSEIRLKNKKVFLVLIYRSPSQSADEFDNFLSNLEILLSKLNGEKPDTIIITGDFNARSPLFWENEITETPEGKKLSEFMTLNNMEQLINEPTHLPRGNIATCIDLIFTNKQMSFVDCGTLPSPDPKCKHLIIHGKLNFQIPCPPKYKRKVWDYPKANVTLIKTQVQNTPWQEIFHDQSIDSMVEIFTKRLLGLADKYIPSKIATFDDRDAPWVSPALKTAIKRKDRVFNKWVKRGRNENEKERVMNMQKDTNKCILEAKSFYIDKLAKKLTDPRSGQKEFWNAYKRFVNDKKNTNIPPLMEGDLLITDFKKKADIFNAYFADQCKNLESCVSLPILELKTNSLFDNIEVHDKYIVDIINKLNPKKAFGHDDISIRLLKMCPKEIAVPLKLIFIKCIQTGKFPTSWKQANVQPVHKKSSRQLKENYRPISLLPICGKIFEKIIFDQLYSFLICNNLITRNQSGFRPGDSTINQLLSITTEIFEAFEKHDEVRAVFLDISKAFDKVWHEGLLFKLKQNGVSENLLPFFQDYLFGRKQRVVLNGIDSTWESIQAGVPQGSVLGPLLFLIYINDLTDNVQSQMKLFADDSSLFMSVNKNIMGTHNQLIRDLNEVSKWANQWKMKFNPDITKQAIEVIFSNKRNKGEHPPLFFNDIPVARKEWTKHLGVFLDEKLSFKKHVQESIIKANSGLSLLKFLSKHVNRKILDMMYKMYVRPHLEYGDIIYHGQSCDITKNLESVQYKAGLIVTGCWEKTSQVKLYRELGWESLESRREFRRYSLFYKIKTNQAPPYLSDYLPPPPGHTNRYANSFFPFCHAGWVNLDANLRQSNSISEFKNRYLKNIRPPSKGICPNVEKRGLKMLSQLRVDHSDLRDHRFNKNFNCISPICRCGVEDETTEHYFMRCPFFQSKRTILLDSLSDILNNSIRVLPESHICHLILYGSNTYNEITNTLIIQASITYIKTSKRFKVLEAFS